MTSYFQDGGHDVCRNAAASVSCLLCDVSGSLYVPQFLIHSTLHLYLFSCQALKDARILKEYVTAIQAHWRLLISAPMISTYATSYYFIYLPWWDGRLSWPRWLVTYPRWFTCLQAVTNTSSNRARCRATSLSALATTVGCHLSFQCYRYSNYMLL